MRYEVRTDIAAGGTEVTLFLRGDLTMVCAKECRAVLLETLQDVDNIHLNLHEVETADVSLIQLICAAHRECVLTGKTMTLDDGPGAVVNELLEKAGYAKPLGCTDNCKATCLWGSM